MYFANGLDIRVDSLNEILKIAESKGYIVNSYEYDSFKFNSKEKIFYFCVLNTNICISLDMDKFIECYTEFLGLLEVPCQSDKIISRIDNGRENKL